MLLENIYSLPHAIRLEIEKMKESGKVIKEINTHIYTHYIEVDVKGVDENGWAFCKVITYPRDGDFVRM